MTRALHLIEQGVDSQTATAAAQLSRQLGPTFEVTTHTVPRDVAALAPYALRLRRQLDPASHDLVHAFGARALAAAVLLRRRVIYTPAKFPTRRAIRWLRASSDYCDLQVVCPTDTMRRAMVEGGVPIVRCHLIRPGVEFAKINRRRDDRLRAA